MVLRELWHSFLIQKTSLLCGFQKLTCLRTKTQTDQMVWLKQPGCKALETHFLPTADLKRPLQAHNISRQHICKIVAHSMLHTFGHTVAICCKMLDAVWPNVCNMLCSSMLEYAALKLCVFGWTLNKLQTIKH